MNAFFLERWADLGNALTAPLAAEIAKIGRALNRIRINGNPATITDRGIDLDVRSAALPPATTLYKVLAVREYDANGDLVDIGDETSPLAAGHSYRWTEDWTRAHA